MTKIEIENLPDGPSASQMEAEILCAFFGFTWLPVPNRAEAEYLSGTYNSIRGGWATRDIGSKEVWVSGWCTKVWPRFASQFQFAGNLLERVRGNDDQVRVTIDSLDWGGWLVHLEPRNEIATYTAEEETLPLAICRAALLCHFKASIK